LKKLVLLIAIVILASCTQEDPKEKLKNLSGYWQIEKVEMENDSVVEYSLSQYIDYIEIQDSIGFRKKLQPKIDGGFIETSKNSEKINAKIDEEDLILYYSTPYDQWHEEVLKATKKELVIINRDNKKYYYKKYEPLLSQNEEETQK